MNVDEFAKYVIDNMNRATLTNALNITQKLDNEQFYKFIDFLDSINKYVGDALLTNAIDKIRACKILVATDNAKKHYESETKYNHTMLIDCYIIELWKIFQ